MTNGIIKYNIADEAFEIRPDYNQDTVCITKAEMAHLFGIDRSGVSRRIFKAFVNGELNKESNVQKMHIPNSDKPVEFFDLDATLAATKVLIAESRPDETETIKRMVVNILNMNII